MGDKAGVAAALLVGVGVALAGGLVGHGFERGRAADRYVTVKGVAERDVEADVALWPLRFVATDDELAVAQARIETAERTVRAFLERQGIPQEQVEIEGLQVDDRLASPYRSGSGGTGSRFIITQTLRVRSEEPERVQQASQKVSELVEAGVVLSASGGPGSGPAYVFQRLNDHKPAMIAEATASAREAALQFAQDSGSRLGGIRRANQGVFVVLAQDRAPGVAEPTQRTKTLRVVSTLEYFLED